MATGETGNSDADRDDSVDALEAMAEGNLTEFELQEVQGQDPALDDESQASAPVDPADVLGEGVASADDEAFVLAPAAEGEALPPAESAQAQQARAAAIQATAQRAQFHQFKSIMIPLLLTVGALLFVLGVIVLIRSAPTPADDSSAAAPTMFSRIQGWFPIASFIVGGVLLFGAWLFNRDLRAAQGK